MDAEGLSPVPPIARIRLGMGWLGLDEAREERRVPSLLDELLEQMGVLGLLLEPPPDLSGSSCPLPLIDAARLIVVCPLLRGFLLGGSTALADGLGWGS